MTRESTTRFRLEDNPQTKGMVMVLLLAALAGQTAILVPLASDVESALYVAVLLPVMSLAWVVYYWRASRGHIEITDERLVLRFAGERMSVTWPDIVRAHVRTISQMSIADRIAATVAGAHQDRRLVEISLRRRIRLPFLPWHKTDPDAIGLPSPFKVIRVYVTNPEGLVEAVAEQLQRTRTL